MVSGKFSKHVILVDADYVDAVAHDIAHHLGRMLGRTLPAVDLAEWLVCSALDAGLSEDDGEIQVIFLHSAEKKSLNHFVPSSFTEELDGQAFRDERFGEFLISSVCDEHVNNGQPLLVQSVQLVMQSPDVKTLTLVTDAHQYDVELLETLREGESVQVCLLTMPSGEPMEGIRAEILAFSLMHAMGVRPDELPD